MRAGHRLLHAGILACGVLVIAATLPAAASSAATPSANATAAAGTAAITTGDDRAEDAGPGGESGRIAMAPVDQPTPTVRWDECFSYVPKRARCGHVNVLADPLRPELGKQRVGFELYPRREPTGPSDGVLVAHEGGPGYPTTESRDYWLDMWGPLTKNRRVLLVDERGTGASDVIRCKALQRGTKPYEEAVARCAKSLGERFDTFGTAYGADDMALVLDALGIDQIELYGVSYGSFFAQTFAVRHPDRVNTLTLDATYLLSGQDPWYRDITRAISDAVTRVCERDPDCATVPGSALDRLRDLAQRLHDDPFESTAYDGEGSRQDVRLDGVNLGIVAAYATYDTTIYRELDAAIRAYDAGYRKPLKRMFAENATEVPDSGSPYYYSAGEYIAVICNDIPALWDVDTPPGPTREAQWDAAVADLEATDPDAFDPFRNDDWIEGAWGEPRTCIEWPSPTDSMLPEPPGATYPDVPTLILSSDLDSITSPEDAMEVADRFPNSTFVSVPNIGHGAAVGDRRGCAEGIYRGFVRSGGAVPDTSCVDTAYQPVRTLPQFERYTADLPPAAQGAVVASSAGDRRVVEAALRTVADLYPRWYVNYTGDGRGLHGGRFSYTGDLVTRYTLERYGFVKDVDVSGRVVWNRETGDYAATLDVDGPGRRDGTLTVSWNDWVADAQATVRGELGGRDVRLTTPAP